MRFIGITGGVGAGKSAILNYLENEYHARILFADDVAKELMTSASPIFLDIIEIFRKSDENIVGADGEIDRQRMAKAMFADDDKRIAVNEIVHPAVKRAVMNKVKEAEAIGVVKYFFLEAALLIEDHYDEQCEELWYIHTSEEVRRYRLKENRGYSDEKINQILASQLKEEEFLNHCKKTIDNSGTIEETYCQIDRLMQELGE